MGKWGSQDLVVETRESRDCTVVSIAGDVDLKTVEAVRAALRTCAGALVIDLRDCTFLSGEGIRALLEGRRQASLRGRRMVLLVRRDDIVARLLDLIDGRTIFNVCVDDLDAALRVASATDQRQLVDRRSH